MSAGLLDPTSKKVNYLVLPGLLLTVAMGACNNLFNKVLLPTLLLPKKINYFESEENGKT